MQMMEKSTRFTFFVMWLGITAVILWNAVSPTLAAGRNNQKLGSSHFQSPIHPGRLNHWAMQVVTPTATITPTATLPPTATSTPTATPTPTSTPAPTLPPIILTGVEPNRIPQATGGTLSVFGGGFTQGSVVRLVGYGLLPTTYVNGNALTAAVPPGVPTGKYTVEVGVGSLDGQTAALVEAVRIVPPPEPTHTPAPTNTPIPTATTAWVFGQPQLLIQSARTQPATLEPGQPFLLTMELLNLGNYVAIDITAVLQSTDLAVASEGSNARIIQRIGVEETASVTMDLVLSDTAADGPQNLNFDLTYFDVNGKSYQAQQSVGLTIGAVTATPTPSATQPRLVLDTYTVEPPDALKPGGVFDLTLNLTNVGDGAAQNIVLTLGGEGGQGLAPFALLNAGNVRYISGLAAGEAVPVPQQMVVAGTADSGVFNLPIALAYDNEEGSKIEDTQVINLLIQKQSQFRVGFYRPLQMGLVGESLDLPVEVVNIGRNLVNVSTVSLSSPDMEFENNSIYVGPLDGGTSGSLDGRAIPQAGGELELTVTVNYLDDFNQPQVLVETLTVPVEAPHTLEEGADVEGDTAETDEQGEDGFWDIVWRFVRGMLGLGS